MYSFYLPIQAPFTCELSAFHLAPSPIQGQDESPWHRGWGAPSMRATAQMIQGIPIMKKQEENGEESSYLAPHRVAGGGLREPAECPMLLPQSSNTKQGKSRGPFL